MPHAYSNLLQTTQRLPAMPTLSLTFPRVIILPVRILAWDFTAETRFKSKTQYLPVGKPSSVLIAFRFGGLRQRPNEFAFGSTHAVPFDSMKVKRQVSKGQLHRPRNNGLGLPHTIPCAGFASGTAPEASKPTKATIHPYKHNPWRSQLVSYAGWSSRLLQKCFVRNASFGGSQTVAKG